MICTSTGAETWTRRLASGLKAKGHQVILDEIPHAFQYYPWLANVSAPDGTDLIIANSWTASAFARRGTPLITVVHHVVHGPELKNHKSIWQAMYHRACVLPMERRAMSKSTRVVAVSRRTAMDVREHLSRMDVDVILNGVDTTLFTPPETLRGRRAGAPLRLLFVGKPSLRKGFDTVAAIVEKLGGEVSLTCVGGAPEPGLPAFSGRNLGKVSLDQLIEEYRQSDLLLFPSRLEGFGYAAAEALSCGLPVICSQDTAVAEIVSDASSIICEANDINGFEAAIRKVISGERDLITMRAAARARAVSTLDEKRWLDEFDEFLKEVVKSN